jgi:hypothetical protein
MGRKMKKILTYFIAILLISNGITLYLLFENNKYSETIQVKLDSLNKYTLFNLKDTVTIINQLLNDSNFYNNNLIDSSKRIYLFGYGGYQYLSENFRSVNFDKNVSFRMARYTDKIYYKNCLIIDYVVFNTDSTAEIGFKYGSDSEYPNAGVFHFGFNKKLGWFINGRIIN